MINACKKDEAVIVPAETPLTSFFADSPIKFGAKILNSTFMNTDKNFKFQRRVK